MRRKLSERTVASFSAKASIMPPCHSETAPRAVEKASEGRMPVRPNSRAMKPISSEKLSPARFDASGAEEENRLPPMRSGVHAPPGSSDFAPISPPAAQAAHAVFLHHSLSPRASSRSPQQKLRRPPWRNPPWLENSNRHCRAECWKSLRYRQGWWRHNPSARTAVPPPRPAPPDFSHRVSSANEHMPFRVMSLLKAIIGRLNQSSHARDKTNGPVVTPCPIGRRKTPHQATGLPTAT